MRRRRVAAVLAAVGAALLALAYRDAAGTLLLGNLISFCG